MRSRINRGHLVDGSAACALAGAVDFALFAGAGKPFALSAAAASCAGVAAFLGLGAVGPRLSPRRKSVRQLDLGQGDAAMPLEPSAARMAPFPPGPCDDLAAPPGELRHRIHVHLEQSPDLSGIDPASELRDALDELRRAMRRPG